MLIFICLNKQLTINMTKFWLCGLLEANNAMEKVKTAVLV